MTKIFAMIIVILSVFVPAMAQASDSFHANGVTYTVIQPATSQNETREILKVTLRADHDMVVSSLQFSLRSFERFEVGEEDVKRPEADALNLVSNGGNVFVSSRIYHSVDERVVNATESSTRMKSSYNVVLSTAIILSAGETKEFTLIGEISSSRAITAQMNTVTWRAGAHSEPSSCINRYHGVVTVPYVTITNGSHSGVQRYILFNEGDPTWQCR